MDKKNKVISSFISEMIFKKTQPKADNCQFQKKKLLTSFIENQKFIINNKVSQSKNRYPFSKTSERFIDLKRQEEIKGTLVIHKKASLKSSLSVDNIITDKVVTRYKIDKNKSQIFSNNYDDDSMQEMKLSSKKINKQRSKGLASGSIYNLLMSTPKDNQVKGRRRNYSKQYEKSIIFIPEENSRIKRNSSSLERDGMAGDFPVSEKLSEVYERYLIYKNRIRSYKKVLESVPNEKSDIYQLKKNLSVEKEPIKLFKNSSSMLNNSLLSTKDVNTIKSKNFKSLEKNRLSEYGVIKMN